jgi:hypothetical protein
MLQQCGEHANKEHVQSKFAGFHHVLLPVMAQTHHSLLELFRISLAVRERFHP